eukprot:CAMPEP_0174705396 /NCGR_PEP_ID=MMETSP1094-20130205/8640_1 /TAXON_ID=156173 /ORGANISM="Chrysochromulina brevifilum, Strain UTEX LB 985" /LENGTH=262 /DNA_ID=CAMNT_0015903557 /DNA_START=13 /DNA_END=801 /DNA_ORIENTATION=-
MELIRLDRRPLGGQFCVWVDGLAPSTDPAKLERCLIQRGGPLETLVVHQASDVQWATAQFFCEADCERCRQHCDGMVLDGRRVQVRRPTKGQRESSSMYNQSLSSIKAIDLMNHFLGFNGWSSEVLALWKPEAPDGVASSDIFSARVRVSVAGGIVVEGVSDSASTVDMAVGGGLADLAYAPSARHKKAAITNALRAALAQLVIIRFPDGRAVCRAVEIDSGGDRPQPAPVPTGGPGGGHSGGHSEAATGAATDHASPLIVD